MTWVPHSFHLSYLFPLSRETTNIVHLYRSPDVFQDFSDDDFLQLLTYPDSINSSTMSRRPLKPALEPQPVAPVATQPPQQHGEEASAQDGDSSGNLKEETLSPTTPTSKKRKATKPPAGSTQAAVGNSGLAATASKRPRTNTPWTPQEEQRLKQMRDAGNSWSEIAKTFPLRTEGSVKKHWYKVRNFHFWIWWHRNGH